MLAVIDTNVLVSRFVSVVGTPSVLFELLEQGRFRLLVSQAILDEYQDVLSRDKFQRYHRMSNIDLLLAIELIKDNAQFVESIRNIDLDLADPDDNKFIECAVAGGADFIMSGDRHLLKLGSYLGIQIVTPAMFVDYLAANW